MSENYYMYGYRQPDQNLIDEIYELKHRIEDLESEIAYLQDELAWSIPIAWINEWNEEEHENNAVTYMLQSWEERKKENETDKC